MQFFYWSQLDKFTRFGTRVESAVWNAVAKDWTLTLRDEKSGEKSIEKFTFLVSCVGGLHVPNIPDRAFSSFQNKLIKRFISVTKIKVRGKIRLNSYFKKFPTKTSLAKKNLLDKVGIQQIGLKTSI